MVVIVLKVVLVVVQMLVMVGVLAAVVRVLVIVLVLVVGEPNFDSVGLLSQSGLRQMAHCLSSSCRSSLIGAPGR